MYGDDGMLYIAGTSTPLVNDIQVRNFTSAGERSWQLRYDYDFVALGIPGLTAMARYASGAMPGRRRWTTAAPGNATWTSPT